MDDLYEPFRYQDPLRSMILWNSPTCGHGSWENSSGKTDEIIHWNWAEQLHFRCDLTTQIQKRLETVLVLPIHPDSDGPYGPSHHVKKSGLRVDNHFQLVWVAQ